MSVDNLPVPRPIDISLFSKRSNKTTRLINNSDPNGFIAGKKQWYEYEFESPIFIVKIEIKADGYSNWNDIEFEIDSVDKGDVSQKCKIKDGASVAEIGKLSRGFKFRLPQRLLSNTKLLSVVVVGLTIDELNDFEKEIMSLDQRAADILARERALETSKSELSDLKSQINSLQSELGKATAQRDEIQASITTSKGELLKLQEAEKDTNQEISIRNNQLREVKSELSDARDELEVVTREVRLFPSEIVGFVKEGNRSIYWYIGISAPFVIIMYIVLSALFSSAIDLTQLWRKEENVNIWTVFLTRLPFVVVAAALVEACGYIVGRLVSEIVRINRQRLEFSKLSIIAKDVSAASANATDLTEDQIFEKETALKMELLREHMKNLSGLEFEYKGGAIISSIVGVANKLVGKTGQD